MSPEATSNSNTVLDSKSCNYAVCLTSRLTHDLQERLAAYLVLPNGQPLLAKAKSSVDCDPTPIPPWESASRYRSSRASR